MNNHIHSYKKVRGRPGYYMCTLPECPHYIARELLQGKKALCPKCGEPFITDREDLTYATVVCKCCHNGPRAAKLRRLREAVRSISKGLNGLPVTQELLLREEFESTGIRKKISFSPVSEEEEILEAIGEKESIGMEKEKE